MVQLLVRAMDPDAVLGLVGDPAVDEAGPAARAKPENVVSALRQSDIGVQRPSTSNRSSKDCSP